MMKIMTMMMTIVDFNDGDVNDDDDGDDGGSPLYFPEHANRFSRSQLGKKDDADDCCDDDDDSDDDDDDDDIQIGPGLILKLELAVTRRQMELANAAATYYCHSLNWIQTLDCIRIANKNSSLEQQETSL